MRDSAVFDGKRNVAVTVQAIALAVLLAFTVPPATAQTTPLPPPVARAPQIAPPTRSEIERVPVPAASPHHLQLTISGGIERSPCPLDEARFVKVGLTLTKIVFAGLGPVDPASLEPAWRPLVGRALPIGVVCEVRDAAAALLRRQGYLASVQVPPQRIEGGVVRIDVVLARLVAIHVRGDAGHAERKIAAYLEPLKKGAVFNQKEAERALLLAGDLPGFEVHLALRSAGTVPGEVVGDVTVTRTPFVANLNLQNFGSSAVGPFSALASFEADDLLGLGDRLTLGLYSTANIHEQTVVQGSYELRPGASGLTLAARGTYARTRPHIGKGDPLRAQTAIGTFEASYPFIRRQAVTLRASGGLDVISQKVSFTGLPLTDDQLRMLYLRLDTDATDPAAFSDAASHRGPPLWHVAGTIELRHGIATLGASRRCDPAQNYAACAPVPAISRLDADPQATLIRASGSATIALLPRWTLVLSPRAQVAFAPLLSFEQFSIGNYTVGRGYDPGALNGDSGIGEQTELRFGPLAVGHVRSLTVQPFAFVDVARVWNLGPIASIYRRQDIATLGGGARFLFADRASAEITLAAPIGETPLPDQHQGVRLLVSLTTHFSAGQ